MESVQSQLGLSFAKQVKYHSVNIDFKVKTCYTAKAQNPSEGTEQCSNNFGQVPATTVGMVELAAMSVLASRDSQSALPTSQQKEICTGIASSTTNMHPWPV